MDRITELEREIAQKQAELKVLKEQKHLSFAEYSKIAEGFHRTSVIPKIRDLALLILASRKEYRPDGSYYIDTRYVDKVRDLSAEQIKLANSFISELYPIIDNYVHIVLENREAL